jgi:superfamily II DNA or RNA helicase
MGRLSLRDCGIRDLVGQRIVPAYLRFGSVNALTQALNEVLEQNHYSERIYPNRIHTLLSDDPDRFINEETATLIQRALKLLPEADADEIPEAVALKTEISQCWGQYRESVDADQKISKELRVPLGVVHCVLEDYGEIERSFEGIRLSQRSSKPSLARHIAQPDWSFQDDAVRLCLQALQASPCKKVGVVIPTGGGKTRVALRIVLRWLVKHTDGNAVWLTHRCSLREQARTELQQMLSMGIADIPEDAAELLAKRIEFRMLNELEERLLDTSHPPTLLVVDEAHHVAAPSYQSIFDTPYALNGLFLTATPNRTDGLPIGIDEIAYSITFGELERRGVIIRPQFEDLPVEDFDWSSTAITDLANYVIERAVTDFTKVLVLAPRVERVIEFYEALREQLLNYTGHPLVEDDLGYIYGGGNSRQTSNEEFLDRFRAKPRGIYVSAQLLLEGFNDPGINTVVITYPSGSLIQLMQAVGRCVRYTPNKQVAYVIQARNDVLAYYFDQRWLYQEISDELRPQLIDIQYSDRNSLVQKVLTELEKYHVPPANIQRIQESIVNVKPGSICRLMLTGLPYFGDINQFETKATWNALLETNENSQQFRWIFNDFCTRGASTADPIGFLCQYGRKFGIQESFEAANDWRQYSNLLTAMYQAKEELYGHGAKSAHGVNRAFERYGATTWLKYVTFGYVPSVNPAFADFLKDCHNTDPITSAYIEQPNHYAAAIKLPLPLGAHEAYLLSQKDWLVFDQCLSHLRRVLQVTPESKRFATYEAELVTLSLPAGLPLSILKRLEYFLRPEDSYLRVFRFLEIDSSPNLPSALSMM